MEIIDTITPLINEGKTEEASNAIAEYLKKEVTGLKSKNEELLGKLKDSKDSLKGVNERLEALEGQKRQAEEDAITKEGDVEKLRAQLKQTHAGELQKVLDSKQELQSKLNSLIIDNGLTDALAKSGVEGPMLEAARALIEKTHKSEIAEDNGKLYGTFDGKAVKDFVTEWAASETGKHFVSAAKNNGGGAHGASGDGKAIGGKTITRAEFDQASDMRRMQISKEGVRVVD